MCLRCPGPAGRPGAAPGHEAAPRGRLCSIDVDPSLPGADLVERGLGDLVAGVDSTEAALVSIAATALRDLGYEVVNPVAEPELHLYRLLQVRHGDDAYGRYNALLRRLVSFQRAATCVRP